MRIKKICGIAMTATMLPVSAALAMESPPGTSRPVGEPALQAAAFRGSEGSTLTFKESVKINGQLIPDVRRILIQAPRSVRLRAPAAQGELGFIRFETGDRTRPVRHKVALRRRASLGGGRYSLANNSDVRVVTARNSASFMEVKLPAGARSVAVTLSGTFARGVELGDGCKTLTFRALFSPSSAATVKDSDIVSARELRSARLC